jgi:hypothetical protein
LIEKRKIKQYKDCPRRGPGVDSGNRIKFSIQRGKNGNL